jgi:head-tail adaptor
VRLARRLVLERAERLPDGHGGYVDDWVPLGTLWADIRPLGEREEFVAGRQRSVVRYRIVVRAAPVGAASRPKARQRFRDGVRAFRVLSVTEFGMERQYLRIVAEEGLRS